MEPDGGAIALVLALIALYAAWARRLDRHSVTGAMVFTAVGVLAGDAAFDILPVAIDTEATKLLAEVTLAVLLFTDASMVNARAAGEDSGLVGRMLGLALPLTVVAGAVLAWLLVPDLGWAGAALLAAVVAPTDAALGLAVFTDRRVPARVRRVLNVESGVNDGLATPVVVFFIAVVAAEEVSGSAAIGDALVDLAIGVGMGVAVGALGALALLAGRRLDATTPQSEDIGLLALAVLSYVAAVAASGNGFVAAFVGGLALGAVARGRLHDRLEVTESVGVVLSLVVWTIFGAVLAGPVLTDHLDWRPVVYAVLSLTVVRMLPVALALTGTGARTATRAFMGWFGPRGLASVVFTLLVVIELEDVAPVIAEEVRATATWVILLSVVLHGLSARPLGRRYGEWASRLPAGVLERHHAPEPPRRRRAMGADAAPRP
jgi:NhaP-type Na+/H+ or K+/H+ antiporter